MEMRNEKLDIFRGLAMIWVILVHCLYYLDYFSWQKSFLLIEMPLFFFIAGASNGMASKKILWNFYLTRFQRILIPYWIYSIICIAIISIVSTPETIKSFIKLVCGWLTLQSSSYIKYLSLAIWFIPVYLLVMLAFPLFEKIRNTQSHYIRYLPLIFLLLLIGILNLFGNDGSIWYYTKIWYYARMFVFYSFFTYLGLFFKEITERRRILPTFTVVVICLLTIFVLVNFWGQSLDMQYNKFPPNFMFFSFSLIALSILYVSSDIIVNTIMFLRRNKFLNWIYQQYVQYGLTIYLFHSFIFFLLDYLKKTCFIGVNEKISFTIIFLLATLLSAVIGKTFSWVERINIFRVTQPLKRKGGLERETMQNVFGSQSK